MSQQLEGAWYGVLGFRGQQARVALRVSTDGDGSLVAVLDSPDGNPRKVRGLQRDGDTVRFELENPHASYEGTLDAGGSVMAGHLSTSQINLRLTLERLEREPDWTRPQDPKVRQGYREHEVIYENRRAGVRLAGTLSVPDSAARAPAVLLLSGTGSHDRNQTLYGHRPFLVLADVLSRKGIAVLRADDRGVGGSTGDSKTATDEDFAMDALSGIEFLAARDDIDPGAIGLVGHSEGGVVASLAAARSTAVKFIVLLASPALSGEDLMLARALTMARSKGMNDEEAAAHRSMLQRLFEVLKNEPDHERARSSVRQVLADDLARKSPAGILTPEDQVAVRAGARFYTQPSFRYLLTYDARSTLAAVRCPLLAIYGAKDVQLKSADNLPALAAALESGGHDEFTIIKVPRLNHMLQTCKTGAPSEYTTIDETIAPVVLETMAGWIRALADRVVAGGTA